MIEEKGICLETNLLESEGHFGLTIQMLIDFIASMPAEIVGKIKNTFSQIDFQNGDVMHYINHLATGMVAALGY